MILGVSIGRTFDDYGFLHKQLSAIEFTEIASVPHALLKRYAQEERKCYQEIEVFWKDLRGCTNVKEGKWGPYNGDALKEAAQRFAQYSDQILEISGGFYRIPKEYKHKIIESNTKKLFKF